MRPKGPETLGSSQPMAWQNLIQGLGHRIGVQIARWPPADASLRRRRLLERLEVDLLFDVGANIGQYGAGLRRLGYEGRIVSFEPLSSAFAELEEAARHDPLWTVRNEALGRAPGEAELNVSAASVSSSLLPTGKSYVPLLPEHRYVSREAVRVEALDEASAEFLEPSTRPALKLDVQGYEMNVILGGPELLRRAVFVESELNLVELYRGQAAPNELLDAFYEVGLRLAWFEPGGIDEQTGALLWADAFFMRDPQP